MNKKLVVIIGVLFFANLMFATANNAEIKVDGEGEKSMPPKEIELKLENWMLNADLFQEMINNGETFFAQEREMELEPWMLNPVMFGERIQGKSAKNSFQNSDTEKEIELEPWMLDVNKF